MSSPTRETAGKIATIWPKASEDEYGRKVYGAPYSIQCTIDSGDGSTYADSKGIEFTPTVIAWAEFDGSFAQPREGDFIAPGDHTAEANPETVQSAIPIKSSTIADCSLLMEPDDVKVMA